MTHNEALQKARAWLGKDCGEVIAEHLEQSLASLLIETARTSASLALAGLAESDEEPEKCGDSVCFLIAGASYFPCVLRKGHEGNHRAGGTCFTLGHGKYLGEPNSPPKCPKCFPKAKPENVAQPKPKAMNRKRRK